MSLRLFLKSAAMVGSIVPLCVASPTFAAPAKKRAPAATPAKKPAPVEVLAYYLAANRFESGENIANACRRADFKGLAISLNEMAERLHIEKGEYETTAQFAERSAAISKALNGEERIFCQPLGDNEDLPFDYDADAQQFAASFRQRQNVWRDVKQLGSYRSRTRMGVAATVKASAELEYNVALKLPGDDDSCGRSSSYSSFDFRVPVAATVAPQVKANGFAAFIGKLVPPFVTEDEKSGSPTLDDPYDEYHHELVVQFEPRRVVVVDGAGKELWSCGPAVPTPNSPPTPKGNPGVWVSNDDYPSSAIRQQAQGTVGFMLSVDMSGRVTGCTITASSGSQDLDDRTCHLMKSRARFRPATDGNANPIAGTWASRFNWQLSS